MTTRRSFIASMAVASAGCMAPPGLAASMPGRSAAHSDYLVDPRHAQAGDFSTRAALAGGRVHSVSGDISSLWFRALRARAADGQALAGLTCPTALFCLEHLAWDHQMRVAFRIDHLRADGGHWRHVTVGRVPGAMMERFFAQGADFGATAFDAIARSAPSWSDATHAAPPAGTAELASAPLTTWVIAPLSRAQS